MINQNLVPCFSKVILILTVFIFAFLPFSAFSQNVYQTAQSGKWSSSSTWSNNNKPGDVISNGETIIIDHAVDFDNVRITNGGIIIINASVTGFELNMNNGSSLSVNSTTEITSLNVSNGTINLNAPLTSTNFSATGTTIYTSNTDLLVVNSTVKNNLVSTGAIKSPKTLPVRLISFSVKSSAESNLLSWVTVMEVNSAYIALERSADGKNFEEVNRQASTNNYEARSNYQFRDTRPGAGVNYYRLRQADTDGTVTYSGIISSASNPFKIYTGEHIYFNAPVSGKATIISMAGAVVSRKTLVQETEVSLKQLPAGVYVMVIEQGNQVFKQKIVL